MKRLPVSICALVVMMAVPSFAAPGNISAQKIADRKEDQQQGRREGPQAGNPGQAQQRGNERQQGGRGPGQAIPNQGQQGRGAPNAGAQGRNRAQVQSGGNQAPQAGRPAAPRGGRPAVAQGAPNRGGGRATGPVEHGPAQFEKRAFQRNETAPRRFRVGAFRAPPGWQYRRWNYGQILPTPFWAQAYWITNFWLYDLDRPPVGFEWVRNGPDALLVDTTSGEILEVEYNVFY